MFNSVNEICLKFIKTTYCFFRDGFRHLPETHQGHGGDGFGHRVASEQRLLRHLRIELLVLRRKKGNEHLYLD